MTERIERPRYLGLEPGELLPDGSGDWLTIPPGSYPGEVMLMIFDAEKEEKK